MLPPPLTAQANAGCDGSACPNWSEATAVNCCVLPIGVAAVLGDTTIELKVWFTVTARLLVTERLLGSLIEAVSV